MKKKNFAFLLILLLSVVTWKVVNAQEIKEYLTYDWSIKQGPAANYLYYDETIEDTDGYVTISIDNKNHGVMRKITKDGKSILWEKTNDKGVYLTLRKFGDYYYTILQDLRAENWGYLYLCRFEKDGTLNKYITIDFDKTIYHGEIYDYNNNLYVITSGQIEGTKEYGASKVYTIVSNTNELSLEKTEQYKNVTTETIDNITGNRTDFWSQNWEEIFPEEHENLVISNQFNHGDYVYAVGDVTQSGKTYGFLLKVDKNKKVIWLKKAEENVHYFDATSPSAEYIAVVAYKDTAPIGSVRNPANVETYIYVYEKEGNMVETHDVAKEIGTPRADVTQMLPFDNCIVAQAFAYDENGVFSSYAIRYTIEYFINTKVEGKGNIEVVEKSKSGDAVTFKVTPEAGYVLGVVKVTDASGNVVYFTSNTFTMPSADVTIEATFVPENPDTGTFISYVILAIFLTAFTTMFILKERKRKFYKI